MRHPDDELRDEAGWTGEGHPDEGTMHAWLDGALEPADASRFEGHVEGCAECRARVAEARGLIAAASGIVSRLDSAPGAVSGAIPPASASGASASGASASGAGAVAGARGAAPVERAVGPRGVVSIESRRPRRAVPFWKRGPVQAIAAVALMAAGVTAVLQDAGTGRTLSEASRGPAEPAVDGAVAADAAVAAVDPAAAESAAAVAAASAAPAGSASGAVGPVPVLAPEPSPAPEAERRSAPLDAVRARGVQPFAPDSAGMGTDPVAGAPQAKVAGAERMPDPRPAPTPGRASEVQAAPPPPPPAPVGSTAAPRPVSPTTADMARSARAFSAEPALVRGVVVAEGSGAPVAGASVRVRGRPGAAVTDSLGRFSFTAVPGAAQTLEVRRAGYRPDTTTLDLTTRAALAGVGEGAGVTIALSPDALVPSPVTVTGAAADSAPAGGRARRQDATADAAAREARASREEAEGRREAAAAPRPLPASAVRFVGCFRILVQGASSEARDRAEAVLPGWLLLSRVQGSTAGWWVAASAADENQVAGARWRPTGNMVTVQWPDAEAVLELRLAPWAEGLAGTASWRGAGRPEGEVSVLARRVACGG